MNKITVISIIIVLILLAGAVWIARPAPNNSRIKSNSSILSSSNEALEAEETIFDFGTISMTEGNVKHLFKIKNKGSKPVIIEKIYTSCMCTTASLIINGETSGPYGMPGHGFIPKINKTLDVGKEAIVEVVFDPAAHGPSGVGQIKRVVTIENNAGQQLNFRITANVTP